MGSRYSAYLRLFVVLCLASTLLAQVSRTGGELFGTVVDQAGLRVAGAVVEVRNLGTNQTRTVESDANGEFRVGNLASATYVLTVNKPGFATYTNSAVSISVGTGSELTIRLKPEEVRQEVTVTDQPSAVDLSQSTLATTIDPERIEELPVRSRNYLSFVLLAPG